MCTKSSSAPVSQWFWHQISLITFPALDLLMLTWGNTSLLGKYFIAQFLALTQITINNDILTPYLLPKTHFFFTFFNQRNLSSSHRNSFHCRVSTDSRRRWIQAGDIWPQESRRYSLRTPYILCRSFLRRDSVRDTVCSVSVAFKEAAIYHKKVYISYQHISNIV